MPDTSDSSKPREESAAPHRASSGSADADAVSPGGCIDSTDQSTASYGSGGATASDAVAPVDASTSLATESEPGWALDDAILADASVLLEAAREDGASTEALVNAEHAAEIAASKAAVRAARRALEKAKADDAIPRYTLGEEIFNAVSHGVGVLLGIAALVLLIVKAAVSGGHPAALAAGIIYGVTIILEYLFSTLYHAIPARGAKRVFRIFDHSCIYLLIAGTYTPFLLVTLADHDGFVLCVAMWVIAAAGILFELVGRERQPRWVTILIYLVMGWMVVLRLPQLIAALDPIGLGLLLAGGLCYTVGTAFYAAKSIRYMHSVWHLWVLAGSVFQFMAVILFVI